MPKLRKVVNADDSLVHKGFKAWVVTDGKPLPLFGVKYDNSTREATAWIPSEAGKKFSVCYRKIAKSDAQDFTAKTYLDGNKVSDKMRHGRKRYTISSIEISESQMRDFVFSHTELTDDDAFLENPLAAELGKIEVVVRAARITREASPLNSRYRCQEIGKIHERSKKGSVHQIKYSEVKARPLVIHRRFYSKPIGDPIKFTFRYQPLEMLQAKGIAPHPIPPMEANDDCIKAELEPIGRQKRARKEVERPVKRLKTESIRQFLSNEVIDLTEEF